METFYAHRMRQLSRICSVTITPISTLTSSWLFCFRSNSIHVPPPHRNDRYLAIFDSQKPFCMVQHTIFKQIPHRIIFFPITISVYTLKYGHSLKITQCHCSIWRISKSSILSDIQSMFRFPGVISDVIFIWSVYLNENPSKVHTLWLGGMSLNIF